MELFVEGDQHLFFQIQHRFRFLEHILLDFSSLGVYEFQIVQICQLLLPGIEE